MFSFDNMGYIKTLVYSHSISLSFTLCICLSAGVALLFLFIIVVYRLLHHWQLVLAGP